MEFPNAFPFLHRFFFISINLCQFLKNLFWWEEKGTEQVMSYSELKEEIHAARGNTVEKCVSVADDGSLLMPLLKHQGVCVSEAVYELRVEMVAMAVTEYKLESVISQSWPK